MQCMKRKVVAVLLAASLLFCCLFNGLWLSAATQMATINGTDVALRNDAGTYGTTVLTRVNTGDRVTVLGDKKDRDGDLWYQVQTADKRYKGYVFSKYVIFDYTSDADFEAYLTSQKFPESYKDGLRSLHAKHPNWVFVAQHLNLDWNTALGKESEIGQSLVQDGSGGHRDSWKSMEEGAYDWVTKKYIPYDSGGWVTAQREVVAYYMDPRNFLNEQDVFQFEQLSLLPTHTLEGVTAILDGTFMESMASVFMDVAKAKNVNAYLLAVRAFNEQGATGNDLGKGTVANFVYNGVEQKVYGFYNFFDIGAYAVNGLSAIQKGAMYARDMGWNTPKKAIEGGADQLGRGYVNMGQDTLYLQKFDVVDGGNGLYGHEYMSNVTAARVEGKSICEAYTKTNMLKGMKVFKIPVYLNMPATAQLAPQSNGNNDNTLTALSVSGYSLTPTFSRYKTEYAVTVPKEVTHVTVNATKSDSGASVTGIGKITLSGNSTVVSVKVTAPSGLVRTYTITVNRPGGGTAPTIGNTSYKVGTNITGIKPNTSATDFLKGLPVNNGTATLVNAAGATVTGNVGTGHIVKIMAGGAVYASYPVVIYGDTNGDGTVASNDLRIAQKHILGISKIAGAYLAAADSNKDGNVASNDLRITQKQILGISSVVL